MTRVTDFYQKNREKLKADYLAGYTPEEICKKYGYTTRYGVYYYLKNLTPEERSEHVLNLYKRKEEKKNGE